MNNIFTTSIEKYLRCDTKVMNHIRKEIDASFSTYVFYTIYYYKNGKATDGEKILACIWQTRFESLEHKGSSQHKDE